MKRKVQTRGAIAALMVAVIAGLGAIPARAAQPVATLEDFLAICPAVLFDRKTLGDAQKAVGLRKIDNSPLAFGWQTQTFTNAEGARAITVTKMVFGDSERYLCAARLDRQMSYEEIEALRKTLEAMPAFGPLDGKVYPYPAGTSNAVLKKASQDPLVVVTVEAAGGQTDIVVDHWRGLAK